MLYISKILNAVPSNQVVVTLNNLILTKKKRILRLQNYLLLKRGLDKKREN